MMMKGVAQATVHQIRGMLESAVINLQHGPALGCVHAATRLGEEALSPRARRATLRRRRQQNQGMNEGAGKCGWSVKAYSGS